MSTHNAGALSSTDVVQLTEDNESADVIEQLIEIIDDLEEENEELRDRIDDLESQMGLLDALRKKVNTLEENHEEYREDNERDKADIRKFAKEQAEEAGSGDDTPRGNEEETTPQTPIERCFDDPETSGVRITASVQRAMRIVGNFDRWAERVGTKGRHVVKDNLRTLLGTAGGERLAWKQVYRAAEKLEELSNGGLAFKKHRKHGWMIELEDERLLARVVSEQRGG